MQTRVSDYPRVPGWGRDLTRRVEKIEALEPAVLAERINTLSRSVDGMTKAFYMFAFSVLSGTILFALSVFAYLGMK